MYNAFVLVLSVKASEGRWGKDRKEETIKEYKLKGG
jgi:hypothetical protein